MNIVLEAPVYGQSGFEVLSRGIAIALHKLGVNVTLLQKNEWNKELCFLDEEDYFRLRLMERNPISKDFYYIVQQSLKSTIFKEAIKSFCFTLFETNHCPVPWVKNLNQLTETWVFSDFNKKAFSEDGVKNVEVIPFGIDTKLFNPNVEPFKYEGYDKEDFVFITNGDFTERKNFEGLIEAYVKEFTNEDKVCLIIKAHYSGFIKRYKMECFRKIKEIVNRFNSINPPKILFLGDKIPWYDMPKFYTAGDCFILVSRGEGLGYPYAEALACGVPVISNTFGGQMQFLNQENAIFVLHELKVIDDLEYLHKCLYAVNHSWAHVHIDDVRQKMRFAFEYRDIIKEKGLKGRSDMEKLTWQNAGLGILERIMQ